MARWTGCNTVGEFAVWRFLLRNAKIEMMKTLTLALLAMASRAVQAPSVPVYVLVYTAGGGVQWAHLNGATFAADPKYPTLTLPVPVAPLVTREGTPITSLEPGLGIIMVTVRGRSVIQLEIPQ